MPPSSRSSSFPFRATEDFRPCWLLVSSHWSLCHLLGPSVLTRPQACEYMSLRHTCAPILSVRFSGRALLHLSPVQGLLGAGGTCGLICVPGYMGDNPSVPPRSSSLPHVLSRDVGITGGRALGPQSGQRRYLVSSALLQVTWAQDGELGKAWA